MKPPEFFYPSTELHWTEFVTQSISCNTTIYGNKFEITPSELPFNITFDSNTGEFYGTSLTIFDDQEYYIIASNPYGTSKPVRIILISDESSINNIF